MSMSQLVVEFLTEDFLKACRPAPYQNILDAVEGHVGQFVDTLPEQEPELAQEVGNYFLNKVQSRIKKSGYASVAIQLKKQGVPLEIARLLMFGRL